MGYPHRDKQAPALAVGLARRVLSAASAAGMGSKPLVQ